tara:strand:- start:1461 stop:1856 length:396 start_codon:yes stop_codon:yes gene_type:complete
MDEKEPTQAAVRLNIEFVKEMQKNANSLANRASAVVIDEERGLGFELTDESRSEAVTLFMTLKAMSVLIDWILESQEEFEGAVVPGSESGKAEKNTCLVPAPTLLKIVECTRISNEAQDALEKHGISLALH